MQNKSLPVALVLGAFVLPGGKPSAALRRRALHAADLWKAGQVRALVASGAERWHGPSEAALIAQLCCDAGVPEDALTIEERATSTEENIVFAVPLLARLGAQAVIIVTDRAHGPRARLVARRQGLTVRVSSPKAPINRHTALSCAREVVAFAGYWVTGAGRR